jgi:tetratricopeptide (TPR) repeat protein
MKTTRILLVMAAVMLLGSLSASAQGRFGADSANCVNSLNFYQDYLKQGNIDEAAPLWHQAIKSCPEKASQNMYIHGSRILKHMINKVKADPARRQVLVDSLIMIHQRRADLFPKNRLRSLENKAFDMMTYFAQDDKNVFDETAKIIEFAGANVNPDLVVMQMNRAKALYEAQKIDDETVLNTYSQLFPVLDAVVKANPTDDNKVKMGAFENAFILSGVANCDNLVKVFTPRFEANPNDISLIKSVAGLLSSNGCVSTELFMNTVSKLHELEPSFSSARLLYQLCSSKDQNEEAVAYLQQAIDSEESVEADDAAMLLEMATFQFKKMNQYGKAVQTAKEAIEKDASVAAKANLLIGTIWYQVKCGGNEIEQRAKFWVATDYLQKAKNADPALAADADELLRTCRTYFPTTEDAFMYDLQDGQSFTISCGGMSATTTVRTNK